jgi:putative methionine-R-sulfoxide reductase with GAF domain
VVLVQRRGETIIVPDVDAFPGHIACSSLSRSEITVPLVDGQGVTRLVLDIDSTSLDDFDWVDQQYLEKNDSFVVFFHSPNSSLTAGIYFTCLLLML